MLTLVKRSRNETNLQPYLLAMRSFWKTCSTSFARRLNECREQRRLGYLFVTKLGEKSNSKSKFHHIGSMGVATPQASSIAWAASSAMSSR